MRCAAAALSLCLLSLLSQARGQAVAGGADDKATPAQATGVPDNECLRRTILVSVVDSAGKPTINLDKNNFQIRSKTHAVKILAATAQKLPPRAILAIDVSGSMLGPEKTQVLQALALGIINAAGESPLALVTFSEQIGDRLDFATPKDSLVRAVQAIRTAKPTASTGRRTALFDSLLSALDIFAEPHLNDTIFLITDGGDNRSKTQLSEMKQFLFLHNVRVFTLLLAENEPTPEGITGPRAMIELSRDTGGMELSVLPMRVTRRWDASPDGLANAKADANYIYRIAELNYRFDVEVDHAITGVAKLTVEAVAANGNRLSSLQVLYPRQLVGCNTPTKSARPAR